MSILSFTDGTFTLVSAVIISLQNILGDIHQLFLNVCVVLAVTEQQVAFVGYGVQVKSLLH